jgi:hypothetical protein
VKIYNRGSTLFTDDGKNVVSYNYHYQDGDNYCWSSIALWYVDSDVNITGSIVYTEPGYNEFQTFELNLKRGWNYVKEIFNNNS